MPIQTTLVPRVHALSPAFTVRRVLPLAARRHVGPFVFFDHFGPVTLPADADADVGPHPHIGLATVTYLFEGRMLHRDSLGSVQEIAPGDVNWMTAGRGIVHSERRAEGDAGRARPMHGLQLWVALPPELEGCAPAFQHVEGAAIPEVDVEGARIRVLAGRAFDVESPVRTASPTLYLDVRLHASGPWMLPPLADEQAVYATVDDLRLDGVALQAGEMAVLEPGRETRVDGVAGARLVVIGGQPPSTPPFIWWNFVASDPARIEQAARRWEDDAFDAIPGETTRLSMPPYRPLHHDR
jgi:redox-sensitive bicupin YhaK (pirin superfamily)